MTDLAGLQQDGSYWHRDTKHCVQDREGKWGTYRFLDEFDIQWYTERGEEAPPVEWVACAREHGDGNPDGCGHD